MRPAHHGELPAGRTDTLGRTAARARHRFRCACIPTPPQLGGTGNHGRGVFAKTGEACTGLRAKGIRGADGFSQRWNPGQRILAIAQRRRVSGSDVFPALSLGVVQRMHQSVRLFYNGVGSIDVGPRRLIAPPIVVRENDK